MDAEGDNAITKLKDESKFTNIGTEPSLQKLAELKSEAQEMFAEGNNLQSLEYFSEILEIFPQDQEALEGRLNVCIKLKLFHRCLRDIDALIAIDSHNGEIHHLSGFVYEQLGAYEESISAYLKAYLLDEKCHLETANKISKICHRMMEEDGKEKLVEADAFELLVSLSKKLNETGKFQVCLDMIKTALMVHCLDKTALKAFREELHSCSTKDDTKTEEFSETLSPAKLSECVESGHVIFLEKIDPEVINDVLLQASQCCSRLGSINTAIWFAKKCLENAKLSENFMSELRAYSKLAVLYTNMSEQRDLSISFNTQVLSKCRNKLSSLSPQDKEMRIEVSMEEREALLRLCFVFKELELYQESEKFAQEYFSKVEYVDQKSLVKAYGLLGELERLQGLYEESIKSHGTELALCLQFYDQRGTALAYGRLGKVHEAKGCTTLAMEYYELHLTIATSLKDTYSETIAYGGLGEGFVSRNNPERALSCFKNQLSLATASNQALLRCQALEALGQSYQTLRLFQHAESFLKKALLEAQELKINDEHRIKKSLIKVLMTLGKTSEALPLLYDVKDHLESKFNKIRGYKILPRHPVLNELNHYVDQILELLAEAGHVEDALVLAERMNSNLFQQMTEYKAFAEGSELDPSSQRHRFLTMPELQQMVSGHKKLVLFYRVVTNGYMAWVMTSSHQGVAHFHWHKTPTGSTFEKTIEGYINGLLTSRDPIASYSCDHRKLYATSHQETSIEAGKPEVNTNESADFLRKLSELFVTPIEDTLDKDLGDVEIVVVRNSFLNLVPFADLYTSSRRSLHELGDSFQALPCISVLGVLEFRECNPLRPIRILGNPAMDNIPESSFRKPTNVQLDLLEEELSDVSVLLGVEAEVGRSATKERFLRDFNSTSLLHLSTYGSHDDGVIALATVPDKDPKVISDDSWAITLEDIVALRQGPDLVVLNSCYGCRNRFHELQTFDLSIPLALMIAGVKAVVMPTWSVPQKVLLASLREFYKNLSSGSSVAYSLLKTKKYLQDLDAFQEPLFWASFHLYGRDTSVAMVESRLHAAGHCSFDKARETAVERFERPPLNEGKPSRLLVSDCLVETMVQILHRHHLYPTLLPTLLDVVKQAVEILEGTTKNSNPVFLPYREITSPWLSRILSVEKFLTSIGFLVRNINHKQTVLIYPHWNDNCCLEKVLLVLQSVTYILSFSPILAEALRVFLSQEDKKMVLKFRDVFKQILIRSEVIVDLTNQPLVRMFWVRRSTHRLMVALGFRKVGPVLDFENEEEHRKACESCLKIFNTLEEFDAETNFKPHPVLSKTNLKVSWMTRRASDKENKAKLLLAQKLDGIHLGYKVEMEDVKKWHNNVLLTQVTIAERQKENEKTRKQQQENVLTQKSKQTTPKAPIFPRIRNAEKESLDLTKFRNGYLTKIKVESGASPSCLRVPVGKEPQVPLIECVMKRHESYNALYKCLNNIKAKKREDVKKL